MRKVVLSLLVWTILSATLPAAAAKVGADQARKAARNFAAAMGMKGKEWVDITGQTAYSEFYIFASRDGQGFILVSGNDCAIPILGYSATATFATEGMPENLRRWLADYERQLRGLRQGWQADGLDVAPAANTASQQWQQLLSGSMPTGPWNTAVAPLITTHWDQQTYYNSHCPYDSVGLQRTMTGCVATAAGQLMRYWSFPDTAFGSNTYSHTRYGTLGANFNTGYNWSNMPAQLTSSSTPAEIDAVATLLYHIGVSVNMDYGTTAQGGSGAQTNSNGQIASKCTENSLRYYFKYKSSLHCIRKVDMTDSAWAATLRNELDNNRPVIYDGFDSTSGHSFLCDGYDNTGLFHFNWGWSGNADGYYAIGSLNPIGSSGPHNYSQRNIAIIGIEPNPDFGSGTVVTATPNTSGLGSVSGAGSFSGTNSTLVTLTATASTGRRFAGWSDGYMHNPRSFYAAGGTYRFTAIFQPLAGDTLGYCADHSIGQLNVNSGTAYWGIRLPASTLTPGHDLTAAQLYILEAGTYTLTVYTGASSPSYMVHTQTFTVSPAQENSWVTVPLTDPVAIAGTSSLWITFSATGIVHPTALTYYSGNNHSRLWGSSFMPNTSWNYSFMIRGVFTAPPVYEDTVSYNIDDTLTMRLGANRNIWWGIQLPPAMHQHRQYLTDVMLYIDTAGSYEVKIYQGDSTTASTRIAQHTATFGTSAHHQWQLIHLPFPVTLTDSLPLWITFQNTQARFPAAMTNYAGDSNSSLLTRDGGLTWKSIYTASHGDINGSWMIRAVFSSFMANPFSIDGPLSVGVDIPVTYTANCPYSANYTWTLAGAHTDTLAGTSVTARWDTVGDYVVKLQAEYGGVVLADSLHVEVHQCNISQFPYTMGFEVADDMTCWRISDADADGHTWTLTANDSTLAHSGVRALSATSHGSASAAHPTDDWAITPFMQLDSGHYYHLTWHDRAADPARLSGHYSVYISTTGNRVEDFTSMPLFQTTLATTSYTQRTLDLTPFAGQRISIAFRLHNTTNRYGVILDDITLRKGNPRYLTLTVLSSDTLMGLAVGGGSYAHGAEAVMAAVARQGYGFTRWNDNNTDPIRTVTVTANQAYTAYFDQLTEFDTIVLRDTTHVHDTTFLHDTTIVQLPVHDTTFVYQPLPHHLLDVIPSPAELGIAVGSGTYTDSTLVEIAAIPIAGNRFVNWSDGTTENPRHLLVAADISLTANFEPNDVAIATSPDDSYTITVNNHDITIHNVTGQQLRVFDVLGRQLSSVYCQADSHTLRMPAAGVYLVQIGNHSAHRIVLR